ncbi:hypothetical protein [Pedobacter sp. R-06]|uniref:hypothetical protein n=1 Tax=Pedobacter sp. R-06 TaxID=3404051 RepID=UPI003CEA8E93
MFFIDLRNYEKLMEEFLMKTAVDFSASVEGSIDHEDRSEEYQAFVLESLSERQYEFSVLYPHNFRSSFFIQLFSVFEHQIRKVSLQLAKSLNVEKKPLDKKGGCIVCKAREVLEKLCGIDFGALEESWKYLETMRKIRNVFVHHQGRISQRDYHWEEIKDYIAKNNDLISFKENIDEQEEGRSYYDEIPRHRFTILIKNSDFNRLYLDSIEAFFTAILRDSGVDW